MPEQDRPQHEPDDQRRQSHEGDRRGEHQYPDAEKTNAERPSQRERDELVERLERNR